LGPYNLKLVHHEHLYTRNLEHNITSVTVYNEYSCIADSVLFYIVMVFL
jgi:hypothetical protein